MPHTRALIGGARRDVPNSVVSLSQCCPSRATLLTGRYAHNHGVLDAARLRRLRPAATAPRRCPSGSSARATRPRWSGSTSTATARDPLEVPPGLEGLPRPAGRRDLPVLRLHAQRGRRPRTGPGGLPDRRDHRPRRGLIRHALAAARPWFLWATYVAPHVARPRDPADPVGLASAVPAPRHRAAFTGARCRARPAFDERDVRDKPPAIRRRPRLGAARGPRSRRAGASGGRACSRSTRASRGWSARCARRARSRTR